MEACALLIVAATDSSPPPFPSAGYGMAYSVVFVIYQVVIVLLLFMPDVNCQAWSDLKRF